MLHACFTPIALCFVYTLWHFYAFFGTNLLTRCHSASSCFLLFSYFRKVIQEMFLELDEIKPKVPILLSRTRSPKGWRRGARRQRHQVVVRVPPWPRHRVVWAPRAPSNIAIPPINPLCRENFKGIGINPRKVPQHRRHQRRSSGDISLHSGTLPGWGIAPGAISIDSTAIFIAVADSHDEEGVVLPRGSGLYR
jgi:hypothetical protein